MPWSVVPQSKSSINIRSVDRFLFVSRVGTHGVRNGILLQFANKLNYVGVYASGTHNWWVVSLTLYNIGAVVLLCCACVTYPKMNLHSTNANRHGSWQLFYTFSGKTVGIILETVESHVFPYSYTAESVFH